MANTLLSLRDVFSFNNNLTHPNAIVFLTNLNIMLRVLLFQTQLNNFSLSQQYGKTTR